MLEPKTNTVLATTEAQNSQTLTDIWNHSLLGKSADYQHNTSFTTRPNETAETQLHQEKKDSHKLEEMKISRLKLRHCMHESW